VIVLRLSPPGILSTYNVNPDNSGGSSNLAIFGATAFFTNQSGGTITIAPVPLGGLAPTTLKVDSGPRALAVDTKDNLLLVLNEGAGTITLVDLKTGQIVGRINAVAGETEDDNADNKHDDRDDRSKAGNMPVLSS